MQLNHAHVDTAYDRRHSVPLDVRRASRLLLSELPLSECLGDSDRSALNLSIECEDDNSAVPAILEKASLLLLRPCLTECVAIHFRPLLVDLCSRWIVWAETSGPSQHILESNASQIACPCHGWDVDELEPSLRSLEKFASLNAQVQPLESRALKRDRSGTLLPQPGSPKPTLPVLFMEAVLRAFSQLLPCYPQLKSVALVLIAKFGDAPSLLVSHSENDILVRPVAFVRSMYRIGRSLSQLYLNHWSLGSVLELIRSYNGPVLVRIYALSIYCEYVGSAEKDRQAAVRRLQELHEVDSQIEEASADSSGDTPLNIGFSMWTRLRIQEQNELEIVEIVKKQTLNIGMIAQDLFEGYSSVSEFISSIPGQRRALCLRDFFKWCRRVARSLQSKGLSPTSLADLNLQTREDILLEASDCFTLMLTSRSQREAALGIIAARLLVPAQRVDFLSNHYAPGLSHSGGNFICGRGALAVHGAGPRLRSKFAPTMLSVRLMESLAVSVGLNEPVLLIGESGTGKTTTVQYLAEACNQKLHVINLSQQTESSDLLGGFKPIEARMLVQPVVERFQNLFIRTFSMEANGKFLQTVQAAAIKSKWDTVVTGLNNAVKMAERVLKFGSNSEAGASVSKRKKILSKDPNLINDWVELKNLLPGFAAQLEHAQNSLLFSFVEGVLTSAVRRGEWVLLDEMNMASAETLESISGLLQGATGSLMLLERGDTAPVRRNPNFRLFACMNPATDAGKRDLPAALRSRFTEVWVDSPDSNPSDLRMIIERYLQGQLPPPLQGGNKVVSDVADFHTAARKLSEEGRLVDGAGQKFYISVRTLCRALSYAYDVAPVYGLRRGLYDGCQMMYTTMLHKDSISLVDDLITTLIISDVKNKGSFLRSVPKQPGTEQAGSFNHAADDKHILFDVYWLRKGASEPVQAPNYVLTSRVESNLRNLARAVMLGKHPILIQGPTSAGKTSMIEYLAKRTGHKFVRVNNHEHTDLQEYVGAYKPNLQGQLVFQEGVLVQALRNGYWIVLDELNLAPTDVLEALNRLLDDNRELFVPETQEVVRPHPDFMLFATQNPPGLYGGRKQLSRAFRSRFIELNFDDIPESELGVILEKRCAIPPSYASKIVAVYKGLQISRQRSRIFEGKNAFVTLRDLFRWGNRKADSWECLAEDGYMLLVERGRRDDERAIVKEVLEKTFRLELDSDKIYEKWWSILSEQLQPSGREALQSAMKRLYVLVSRCMSFKEPVLLVGETGCGKTTICDVISRAMGSRLHIINAHANSETSDFLGSMRPFRRRDELLAHLEDSVRSLTLQSGISVGDTDNLAELAQDVISAARKLAPSQPDRRPQLEEAIAFTEQALAKLSQLFEWVDGPLVESMRTGGNFLLDEISLAEDSVLERLNSVLEPERTLLLAEKGTTQRADGTSLDAESVVAADQFAFFATMNPGGDYGKKELSPALRNRFTEVWVPTVTDSGDLVKIISGYMDVIRGATGDIAVEEISHQMLLFVEWLAIKVNNVPSMIVSLRDYISWAKFICVAVKAISSLSTREAFVHGGSMVLVDSIGVNPLLGQALGESATSKLRAEAEGRLAELAGLSNYAVFDETAIPTVTEGGFSAGTFAVEVGPHSTQAQEFAFEAPTTARNLTRILRGMTLKKPILLEGPPGVGKTTVISTLAGATGHRLCRLNMSEQTDIMDLFGSDLPVEGGNAGEFAWRDGPFLDAMKTGDWVLLDELNLASQQVLEGLNACLDYRAEVYIPELGRTFPCHKEFRIFAAQNPYHQGGGRKGLPKSFLNRFTQVYMEVLQPDDLKTICRVIYPAVEEPMVEKMIEFNSRIQLQAMTSDSFGVQGRPWEFNFRDVSRWIKSIQRDGAVLPPTLFLDLIYTNRMRNDRDRKHVRRLFNDVFTDSPVQIEDAVPEFRLTERQILCGSSVLDRRGRSAISPRTADLKVLQTNRYVLEALMTCAANNTAALLVGPESSGKSSLVLLLGALVGAEVKVLALNSGVDALELLGGFEQVDTNRIKASISKTIQSLYVQISQACLLRTELSSFFKAFSDNVRKLTSGKDFDVDLAEVVVNQIKDFPDLAVEASTKECAIKLQTLKSMGATKTEGKFEWVDGVLIQAIEAGHWLLVDNANLCPASVLDRLNSLLEPDGKLIIGERGLVDGSVKTVTPHPDFRLFITMDPRHGEISRAMRNRCVEIYVPGIPAPYFEGSQATTNDVLAVSPATGFLGWRIAAVLGDGLAKSANTTAARLKPVLAAVAEIGQRGLQLASAVETMMTLTQDKEVLEVLSRFEWGDALLQSRTYPGIWPHGLTARALLGDHELSKAIFDSTFGDFAREHASEWRAGEPDAVTTVVQHLEGTNLDAFEADVMVSALTMYVMNASRLDMSMRLAWFKHFSASQGVYTREKYAVHAATLERILEDLSFDYRSAMQVLLEELHIAGPKIGAKNPLWARLNLVLSTASKEQEQHSLLSKASSLTTKELSILHFSLSFGAGKLPESLLKYDFMKSVGPMFAELREAMYAIAFSRHGDDWEAIEHAAGDLAALYDLLWDALLVKDISDFSSVAFVSQRIIQGLARLGAIIGADLHSHHLTAFAAAVGLDKINVMANLWLLSRTSALRSEKLFNLHQNLLRAPAPFEKSSLDLRDALLISEPNSISALRISTAEALATIYKVQRTEHADAASLLEVLAQLPKEFESLHASSAGSLQAKIANFWEAFPDLTLPATLHCEILNNWHTIEVQALNDTECSLAEMDLLASIASAVIDATGIQEHKATTIVQHLQKVERKLGLATFSPAHAAIVHRLAWEVQEIQETVRDKDAVALHLKALASLTQEALFHWSQGLWTNSVLLLDQTKQQRFAAWQNGPLRLLAYQDAAVPPLSSIPTQFTGHTINGFRVGAAAVGSIGYIGVFSVASRADMWIFTSIVFLDLYVPKVLIDPSVDAVITLKAISLESNRVLAGMLSQKNYTAYSVGNTIRLPHLEERLAFLAFNSKQAETEVSYRPKVSQLGEVVQSLHLLQSKIMAEDMTRALMDPAFGSEAQYEFLQETLASFIAKSLDKYPAYHDLLLPAVNAAYFLKYGLQLRTLSHYYTPDQKWHTVLQDLLLFARVEKLDYRRDIAFVSDILKSSSLSSKLAVAACKVALSLLNHLALDATVSGAPRADIMSHYLDLVSLLSSWWNSWSEKKSKEKAERESLYKYKVETTVIAGDSEEQFALGLFPTYREDLTEEAEAIKPEESSTYCDSFAEGLPPLVAQIHERITKSLLAFDGDALPCAIEGAVASSVEAVHEALSGLSIKLSAEADAASKLLLLFASRKAVQNMERGETGEQLFDFYRDSCGTEVCQIRQMLLDLETFILTLLDRFPDHTTLRQIATICSRICSFPIASPVMKFLSGVEMLLLKCHEWEQYASRDVSVGEWIGKLTQQVVKWRELELRSWKGLLLSEEKSLKNKAMSLWFHLHSTITALLPSLDNDERQKDLVSSLDQFLLGSSVGEFKNRIQILENFKCQLRYGEDDGSNVGYSIIENIVGYYGQFVPLLEERIQKSRLPLEKELIGFIKIATWKDVNVHAMRESSRKSHDQLAKLVRKYREHLSKPVSQEILAFQQPDSTTDGQTEEKNGMPVASALEASREYLINVAPFANDISDSILTLANLSGRKPISFLCDRAYNLLRDMAEVGGAASQAIGIDDFASHIIASIKSFQSEAAASNLKKGAKAVRRRALSDLLKFLNFLGEEKEEEGDNVTEEQGTGLGAGEGKADVSESIENPYDVEDLQNENKDGADGNRPLEKNEKNAVEMPDDFDGELGDGQEDEDNKNEQEEDGDEAGAEEQMGSVDDHSAETLDKKLWGDEDNDADEGEMQKDSSAKADAKDEELVAKTSENNQKPSSADDKPPAGEEDDEAGSMEGDNQDNELENGMDDEEGAQNNKTSDDVNCPDVDVEFPENMDLDGNDDVNMNDEEENLVEESDMHEIDGNEVGQNDEQNEDIPEPQDSGDVDMTWEKANDGEEPSTEDLGEEEMLTADDLNKQANDENTDMGNSSDPNTINNEGSRPAGGERPKEAPENEPAAKDDANEEDKTKSNETKPDENAPVEGNFTNQTGGSREADASKSTSFSMPEIAPNPLRNLGDAKERWLKRLNDLADAEKKAENPEAEKDHQESQLDVNTSYEYVQEGDENYDAQALGSATEEQQRASNDIFVQDDDAAADPKEAMEVDDETEAPEPANNVERVEAVNTNSTDETTNAEGSKAETEKVPSSVTPSQLLPGTANGVEPKLSEAENEEEEIPEISHEELADLTVKFREAPQDREAATRLWRLYSAATRDLSFALCESLRMVLEPTQASKMRGDYRTGKRLNMRKVIPYVASQFKKDKIWMRRTKPAKRTYQILLAIDDSRSMSESRSVEFAYESIALIMKALEQLEVGQVGVASFGETVRLVHPFESPLSDEAGGHIFQQFSFDQTSTDVRRLIGRTIELLGEARSGAGGGGGPRDLWQLQIVISDGVMDNHAAVRSLVRMALQQRIMCVFVILDRRAGGDRDSIFRLTSVSYESGPGGVPALRMTPYMETFPFDYFVPLQDVAELPGVLAETLRQYLSVVGN
ncbi:hypothetical protein HK405_007248 [Cladochytrium tenue]|nr:hypothetical protein HK405_007248 [Cladochytrium tenue]